MTRFIFGRTLSMLATVFCISIVTFAIILLPPGDYLSTYIAELSANGQTVDERTIELLRERYGLNQPFLVQYWKWVSGIAVGDFGESFEWRESVADIMTPRILNSIYLEGLTVLLMWAVAIPVGVFVAVFKYSIADYVATVFGFLGLAIPNFLLALIIMYLSYSMFGVTIGGLYSQDLENTPFSLERVLDFLGHAWAPILVLASAGIAQLIRVLRASLLDELEKPYVATARAKGLSEWRLIIKYPVRVAMTPLISTIGWVLPTLVSSSVVVSIVMNLPTAGPLLLRSLLSQDMYLAGSIILLLGILTIVGTLISDILLALFDPRISRQGH